MARTAEEQAIRTGLRSLPPQKEAIILTVITLLTQLMLTDDTPEPMKQEKTRQEADMQGAA